MLFGVDGIGPHEEDEWIGRRVRIGEAIVAVGGHTGRCIVTSRHPDTGVRNLPTLDVLAEYRDGVETTEPLPFGVWGEVAEPGRRGTRRQRRTRVAVSRCTPIWSPSRPTSTTPTPAWRRCAGRSSGPARPASARSRPSSWRPGRAKRLVTFEDAERGLCFGRLDLDGVVRPLYVGRRWVHEEQTPIVVNWQAPAARPFYTATVAEPQGVVLRRRFRTEGRRLLDLYDEPLDGSADDVVHGVADILLEELERSRDEHMRDIVATIQADQYRLITREPDGVLVIQGGPGTGKTAVGLHRASWLLYTYRRELERSGVLVVGPNPVFMDYISHVLPMLGEERVEQRAVNELVDGIEAVRSDTAEVARLKGDRPAGDGDRRRRAGATAAARGPARDPAGGSRAAAVAGGGPQADRGGAGGIDRPRRRAGAPAHEARPRPSTSATRRASAPPPTTRSTTSKRRCAAAAS